MSDYITTLKTVRDFYLADPSRHTTGTFARDENGIPVDATSPAAKSFCLLGCGQHLGLEDFSVSDAMGVDFDPISFKESFSLSDWHDALSFDQLIQGLNARIAELERDGDGARNLRLDILETVG